MWLMQLQCPIIKTKRVYHFELNHTPASNLPTWKNISKDN